MRFVVSFLSAVLLSAPVFSQSAGGAAIATPPDRAALERLNLKTDWVTYLPLTGQADGVSLVETVDIGQIFVQTKSGLVIAIDALTGAKMWSYRMPAQYVNTYPVAVTDQFVFVVNIARLFCFHRYSGLIEFDYELPGSATSGPIADKELVFVIMNGSKLNAYRYPKTLTVADRALAQSRGAKPVNVADAVATRYGTAADFQSLKNEGFSRPYIPATPKMDAGLGPNQLTPSVSALPSVTPPYTLDNRGLYVTPSLMVLPTLRQPYQFRPEHLRYNQETPSLGIVKSLARASEAANFRPRGIEPQLVWTYTARTRIQNQPLLTDKEPISANDGSGIKTRVWLSGDGPSAEGIDKRNGKLVLDAPLQDTIASPAVGPYTLGDKNLGIFGLRDGTLVSVDLVKGEGSTPRIDWRANVGGYLNHRPVVTKDAVFASGEQAGTTRVDLESGDVIWKSENSADTILAINDEFVYIQDRAGQLAVYDRKTPSNPATKRSLPLTTMNIAGFNVTPSNTVSDRILLAADSGIMVSLRDASAKYLAPVPLIPPPKKVDPVKGPQDIPAKPADAPAPAP